MQPTSKWPLNLRLECLRMHYVERRSQTAISKLTGIPPTTVSRIIRDDELYELYVAMGMPVTNDTSSPDSEILHQNTILATKLQRMMDSNRVERKSFREQSRIAIVLEEMHAELRDVFTQHKLTQPTIKHEVEPGKAPVGVVQLSDVHFNELVDDLSGNKYGFDVASKRIQKFITRATAYFKTIGVRDVALFMTGDMLNSDRRLDEITNAATNRSRAIFTAVDILQQAILHLNQNFNVTVASITGNESRVGEHIHWTDMLAGDSYDIVIHNILTYVFRDAPGVQFIPVTNPLESVVAVNGANFLLVHGHGHKGLSRTSNIENEVERLKARYGARGVRIDYVICGHIHSAFISDLYARSSGLPGANAYSERALNLVGKASQNMFVVWDAKTIDGIKVDLQEYDSFDGYEYDITLSSHVTPLDQLPNTYTIQSVVI